jgi:hypothetical protein
MDTARTTAMGFWRHAREFADAARAVRVADGSKLRMLLPVLYLLGHSVELSLKAFLLGRGVPIGTLRSREYGHDLAALLKEARRRRLGNEVPLQSRHLNVIQLLNYEYVAKKYEYRETGMYYTPDPSLTQDVADRLIGGLEVYCREQTLHARRA